MSGFVHADLMHLIFNMMTFYFFAFRSSATSARCSSSCCTWRAC